MTTASKMKYWRVLLAGNCGSAAAIAAAAATAAAFQHLLSLPPRHSNINYIIRGRRNISYRLPITV